MNGPSQIVRQQGGLTYDSKHSRITQYGKIGDKLIKITVDISNSNFNDARNIMNRVFEQYNNTLLHTSRIVSEGTIQIEKNQYPFEVTEEKRNNPLLKTEHKIKSVLYRFFSFNFGTHKKSDAWISLVGKGTIKHEPSPKETTAIIDYILQSRQEQLEQLGETSPTNVIEAFHNYYQRTNHSENEEINKEVSHLEIGQCLIFSPKNYKHHFVCMATKQDDGKITLRSFIPEYTKEFIEKNSDDEDLHPIVFERSDIDMNNFKTFIDQVYSQKSLGPFGKKDIGNFNNLLKIFASGTPKINEDLGYQLQTKAQKASYTSPEMLLLKSFLTASQWELFEQQVKRRAVLDMYHQILSGKAFKVEDKIATLEVVEDSLNNDQDLSPELTEQFLDIKADLEDLIPDRNRQKIPFLFKFTLNRYSKAANEFHTKSINAEDNFEIAFKAFCHDYAMGNYQEANKILSKIYQSTLINYLDENERKKLIVVLNNFFKIAKLHGKKDNEAIDLSVGAYLILNKIDTAYKDNRNLMKQIKANLDTYQKLNLHEVFSESPWGLDAIHHALEEK